MILWTMQPLQIYEMIQRMGVYRCDPARSSMMRMEFTEQYDWLVAKMTERIGPPPEGVKYPVWAWYKQNGKRHKPDLRSERWGYGGDGEPYTCLEIGVPDDQVVLSDFDSWHVPLNNWLLSDTKEEDAAQESYYKSLTEVQQKAYREWNWERIFDVTPFENDWIRQGDWVQATFWELKKEQIRAVRFFKTAKRKRELGKNDGHNEPSPSPQG